MTQSPKPYVPIGRDPTQFIRPSRTWPESLDAALEDNFLSSAELANGAITFSVGSNTLSVSLPTPEETGLVDAGTYFTTPNVEAALQQLAETVINLETEIGVLRLEMTLTTDVAALQADVLALQVSSGSTFTLMGTAPDATDLGTFTGSTISDNTTVKAALQELETALESGSGDISAATIGVAPNAPNLGTFTGTLIPDGSTVKEAIQILETLLEAQIESFMGQPEIVV